MLFALPCQLQKLFAITLPIRSKKAISLSQASGEGLASSETGKTQAMKVIIAVGFSMSLIMHKNSETNKLQRF